MSTAAAPQPSSRLWMPLLVLVGVPLAGAAIWFWPSDWDHGHRTLSVLFLAMLAVLLLAFWLLFFSGLPRWVRLTPVILLLSGAGAFAATLREVHFTGDMMPVFTFRWEPTADELLERDRERQAAEPAPAEEGPIAKMSRSNPFESYFGFLRQGEVLGVKLRDDWAANPPREVWRQRSGGGYAGFVVADGRAVTVEQRRDEEVVVAYDVDTGRELWRHADPARFKETQGGDGPRATPTIVPFRNSKTAPRDYKVFSLGATGHLVCLDLQSGEPVWSADVLKDNPNLRWGMSGSPLDLPNGRIVVTPGAQTETAKGHGVIAYDMRTGTEVWAAGKHRGAYSSPVIDGRRGQLLVFDGEGLTGYQGADGKELWHYPWVPMPPQGINASQPLLLDDDRVFISSGYDMGSAMLRAKETDGKWQVETLWDTKAMRCKFTSPVYRDGYLYGLDEGILTCLDAKDGKRLWKGGRYGHGQLLLVDKHLLILSEKGDLVIVKATLDGPHEQGKVHVLDGDKTWNPPALAGNYVFVRNHEWMACYELPADNVFYPFRGRRAIDVAIAKRQTEMKLLLTNDDGIDAPGHPDCPSTHRRPPRDCPPLASRYRHATTLSEGTAMPKTIFAALPPLLALLALLSPGKAVAGPPEGVSGKMVFDKVGDGLRRYRAEKDDRERIAWLERLAPARDPRVALAIWEYPPDEITPSQFIGLRRLLVRYYVPRGQELRAWWESNEADLRRRAKQLPR